MKQNPNSSAEPSSSIQGVLSVFLGCTLRKAESRHPGVGVGTHGGGSLGHACIPQTSIKWTIPISCKLWNFEPGVGRRSTAGETGNWVQDTEIHTATINKMLKEHSGGPYGKVA